jgi:hypothetical protein
MRCVGPSSLAFLRERGKRRMRQAVILRVAMVAVFLLAACAHNSGAPQSEGEQQEKEEIPSTARIVCDQEGTRVLTPKVVAQPDGVHFVIDNRLKGDAEGYTVAFPEAELPPGGMPSGGNAPKGIISKHVEPFFPGTVKISCDPPGFSGWEEKELDYAPLEVIKGESGYKSTELECSGGGWGQITGGFYPVGVKGKKGNPVDMVRRRFSDEIEEADVVEIAGYPKTPRKRLVRVVREGKVVAAMEYHWEGGGWLEGGYNACEEDF